MVRYICLTSDNEKCTHFDVNIKAKFADTVGEDRIVHLDSDTPDNKVLASVIFGVNKVPAVIAVENKSFSTHDALGDMSWDEFEDKVIR